MGCRFHQLELHWTTFLLHRRVNLSAPNKNAYSEIEGARFKRPSIHDQSTHIQLQPLNSLPKLFNSLRKHSHITNHSKTLASSRRFPQNQRKKIMKLRIEVASLPSSDNRFITTATFIDSNPLAAYTGETYGKC